MSIQESSAAVLVRFTGLGIICFNDERRRGEVAAIRDDKHVLTINIQQPVFKDGAEKDIVVYKDIATYQQLPKEDVQIEIKALGSPAVEGYEIYQSGGDFDRLNSADVNDFRWVVNMDALHGDSTLAPTAERPYPITKIYIDNGLFYAHKLDTNLFFEKVAKDESAAEPPREVFGNVAETVGVKIEAEEVSVSVSVGGKEETHTLRRVPGLPFRVEIKNMDYSTDAVYSDMPDYYKFLSSPDGNQFELSPVAEEGLETEGGGVNQEDFCHPVVVFGVSSIDEL